MFSIFGELYFCVVLFSGFYSILFLILSDFLEYLWYYHNWQLRAGGRGWFGLLFYYFLICILCCVVFWIIYGI
jgi:hypothetical protein